MKNKILLCSVNSRYIHSSLAIYYLYSAIDNEAEIMEWTINRCKNDFIKEVKKINPTLIGFSCYIWNIEYITSVINILKTEIRGVKIVLGGPEVSFGYRELLIDEKVDYIIAGEGEVPFKRLIARLENGENTDGIGGVRTISYETSSYFDNNVPKSPYTEEYFKRLEGRISYIETVRGCPFSCSFCLSGRDEPVKYMPMEQVKEGLSLLVGSGTRTIKFVDRSFNVHEQRAIEIVKYIIENFTESGVEFHFEIAADIMSQRLIDMFCSSPKGLFRLEIGLQSFNDSTLRAVNRSTDLERLKKTVMQLTDCGKMHVHLDLIAGLPDEGLESLKQSFNEAMALGPNVLQLGFLKLLPGSPMAESPKGVFMDKPPYEVISTPWISENELKKLKMIDHILDKLYNSGRFRNTIRNIDGFEKDAFDILSSLAEEAEIKKGESHNDLAEKVLSYLLRHNNNREEIVEAMRIDMKAVNPVGRLPNFLKAKS